MTSADIEQFVDWGDHTVTVDPIRRDHWIYDDGERHALSQRRGASQDAAFVNELASAGVYTESQSTYMPTTRDIDALGRFSSGRSGNPTMLARGWRVAPGEREGKRPVIAQMKYDGVLPNKSRAQIALEMKEAERRISARTFDKSDRIISQVLGI